MVGDTDGNPLHGVSCSIWLLGGVDSRHGVSRYSSELGSPGDKENSAGHQLLGLQQGELVEDPCPDGSYPQVS